MLAVDGPISQASESTVRRHFASPMLAVLAVVWVPDFQRVAPGVAPLCFLRLAAHFGKVWSGWESSLCSSIWLRGGSAGGVWAVFCGPIPHPCPRVWLTRDNLGRQIHGCLSMEKMDHSRRPAHPGHGCLCLHVHASGYFLCQELLPNAANVQFYNCAMFIGFAMTQFIAPITAVMFRRFVRNLALAKKSDALVLTLALTGGFACLAATGCTLFPNCLSPFSFPTKWGAGGPGAWYVWRACVPLALAECC